MLLWRRHKEFTALMKAELPKQRYMTFTWITGSSVGEELEAAINGVRFLARRQRAGDTRTTHTTRFAPCAQPCSRRRACVCAMPCRAAQDMMLVIISLIVFILIAVLFLSKWDAVKTRTSLALAGIFVTAVGIISGWGWGMMFGMPFTPLQRE